MGQLLEIFRTCLITWALCKTINNYETKWIFTVSKPFERNPVVLEIKPVDCQLGRTSSLGIHFMHFVQKFIKTAVWHSKHEHSFDTNCSVVLAGLTKGDKIVASDLLPQTIKNFEVHNNKGSAIRRGSSRFSRNRDHYHLASQLEQRAVKVAVFWDIKSCKSSETFHRIMLPLPSTLMMVATGFFEMSIYFIQTIQCHTLEDITIVTNSYPTCTHTVSNNLLVSKFLVLCSPRLLYYVQESPHWNLVYIQFNKFHMYFSTRNFNINLALCPVLLRFLPLQQKFICMSHLPCVLHVLAVAYLYLITWVMLDMDHALHSFSIFPIIASLSYKYSHQLSVLNTPNVRSLAERPSLYTNKKQEHTYSI